MLRDYAEKSLAATSAGMLPIRETIKQQLERQRDEVKTHLDNLENALQFLKENPNFEAFHDILRKAGF